MESEGAVGRGGPADGAAGLGGGFLDLFSSLVSNAAFKSAVKPTFGEGLAVVFSAEKLDPKSATKGEFWFVAGFSNFAESKFIENGSLLGEP